MKIIHVVGARPNFMKLAPVYHELALNPHLTQVVVHTGQHYSDDMSGIFFQELGLGQPDINLGIGSDTQAGQVGRIMMEIDKVLSEHHPDALLVYGDVNSTLAASLVSSKLGIFTAHVEAGLRSFDRTMPEEINRLVTDVLADLHLTPSSDANDNLIREGIPPEKICLVGNIMIDSLVGIMRQKKELDAYTGKFTRYGIVTLHRPFNVDDLSRLSEILKSLGEVSTELPLIFPVHPRTRKTIEQLDKVLRHDKLLLLDPLPYSTFIHLVANATLVITDSGGIQEETTFLQVPCITLRKNTERPVTCSIGTNTLVGDDLHLMQATIADILDGRYKKGRIPPLWDGQTAARIAGCLYERIK